MNKDIEKTGTLSFDVKVKMSMNRIETVGTRNMSFLMTVESFEINNPRLVFDKE